MEKPKQVCYVCDQEGEEKQVIEPDGRVHVFFVHKKEKGAGRPKRCDGGYEETEAEFMKALEEGDEEEEQETMNTPNQKVAKGYTKIPSNVTTEVFVKMYMHTCQRCSHTWVSKKKTPLVCSKCTSHTWNMEK